MKYENPVKERWLFVDMMEEAKEYPTTFISADTVNSPKTGKDYVVFELRVEGIDDADIHRVVAFRCDFSDLAEKWTSETDTWTNKAFKLKRDGENFIGLV